MRHLILLFAVTYLGACMNKPQADVSQPLQPDEPQPVLTHLNLLHPEMAIAPPLAVYIDPLHFHFSSFVLLKDSAILMKIVRWNSQDEDLETVPNRIFKITRPEWQSLMNGITQFNLQFTQPQRWEDAHRGMLVRIISDRLLYKDILDVGFPGRAKESEYYRILDPLFLILRRHLTAPAEMTYLHDLERHLDYQFPAEVISTTPHKYRISHNLMEFFSPQLSDLIDHMPTDAPITIDMSTLLNMDTTLYPHFQRLLKRNSRVQWLATPNAYRHLLNLGVPEKNIQQAISVEFREY